MIRIYTGTPGSGKSLHLAKDIYHYTSCRRDRLVIANFEVDETKLKHPARFNFIPNKDLQPGLLKEISYGFFTSHNMPVREGRLVLIIDEAQVMFNARTWQKDGRDDWVYFFSQHRKYGYDVYLVAQFDEMIDRQIRSLIEYQVIHRKVTNFGMGGMLLNVLTLGGLFIAIEHWYSIKKKTGSEWFKARKKYYQLYDTFKDFENTRCLPVAAGTDAG